MAAAALSSAQPVPVPTSPQAAPASANVVEAKTLFDDAMALMKDGKYVEACPKLKESQELDPGTGTKYRLAGCYESTGLIGGAWTLFVEVADEAKAAGRADRETVARSRAASLKPKVPMMTVTVPAEAVSLPGLSIELDGAIVVRSKWSVPLAVDPGAHTVRASAPGKKPWQQTLHPLGGATLIVNVPILLDEAKPLPVAPTSTGMPAAPGAATGIPALTGKVPPARPVASGQSGHSSPSGSLPGRGQPQPAKSTRPSVMDYKEGQPIPLGYHVETRKGLTGAGAGVLGGFWALSAVIATAGVGYGTGDASWPLYVPIVGPFMAIGTTKELDESILLLVTDGGLQVGGATMLVLGLAIPVKKLVRDSATLKLSPDVALAPVFTGNSFGVTGTF